MDARFYEFWVRFFSSLARGRNPWEGLLPAQTPGAGGADAFAEFFRGMDGWGRRPESDLPGGELWQASAEAFEKSLKDFLALFDVVSREDYRALQDECEALKEKVASQEKTIAGLKRRRRRKAGASPEETVEQLREVIRKQNEEFQSLMKTASDLFEGPPTS
ncbi:MAG TPA: hypothetical protein DCS11_11080 [Syntrophus sp. (in: bacteria)]|nr:hypothetical protein [Syntrophus sp. (in: bacteria)]